MEKSSKDLSFKEIRDPSGRKIFIPKLHGGRPEKVMRREKGGPWERAREKTRLRQEIREVLVAKVAREFVRKYGVSVELEKSDIKNIIEAIGKALSGQKISPTRDNTYFRIERQLQEYLK